MQQVGFFLGPGFSMVALDRVIELLWIANLGQLIRRYEWLVISPDGGLVNSDRGLLISPDEAIGVRRNFSLVIIISSARGKRISAPHITPWLQSLSHTGCRLGAIGDAALLLAKAGLLDGYSCAVPELLHRDFASEFADTKISHDPFCLDRDRATCTGATTAVDMMLGIIGNEFGLAVAENVSDQLTHNGIQHHQPTKDPTRTLSIEDTDKRLVKAVDLMKKHISEPMRIIDIAHRVGASERKIERLFQSEFHCSPSHCYLCLRLDKAHDLLIHSKRSISYIAYECGFYDASHFDKYYLATFHETPKHTRDYRRMA